MCEQEHNNIFDESIWELIGWLQGMVNGDIVYRNKYQCLKCGEEYIPDNN
jgi:hypothetical protein